MQAEGGQRDPGCRRYLRSKMTLGYQFHASTTTLEHQFHACPKLGTALSHSEVPWDFPHGTISKASQSIFPPTNIWYRTKIQLPDLEYINLDMFKVEECRNLLEGCAAQQYTPGNFAERKCWL